MKQNEILEAIDGIIAAEKEYLEKLVLFDNSNEIIGGKVKMELYGTVYAIQLCERIKHIITAKDRAIAKGVKEILSRPLLAKKEEKSV